MTLKRFKWAGVLIVACLAIIAAVSLVSADHS